LNRDQISELESKTESKICAFFFFFWEGLDPKPNSQFLCVELEPKPRQFQIIYQNPKLKVLHKNKELPNIGLN
jgi:hypothetical protein